MMKNLRMARFGGLAAALALAAVLAAGCKGPKEYPAKLKGSVADKPWCHVPATASYVIALNPKPLATGQIGAGIEELFRELKKQSPALASALSEAGVKTTADLGDVAVAGWLDVMSMQNSSRLPDLLLVARLKVDLDALVGKNREEWIADGVVVEEEEAGKHKVWKVSPRDQSAVGPMQNANLYLKSRDGFLFASNSLSGLRQALDVAKGDVDGFMEQEQVVHSLKHVDQDAAFWGAVMASQLAGGMLDLATFFVNPSADDGVTVQAALVCPDAGSAKTMADSINNAFEQSRSMASALGPGVQAAVDGLKFTSKDDAVFMLVDYSGADLQAMGSETRRNLARKYMP